MCKCIDTSLLLFSDVCGKDRTRWPGFGLTEEIGFWWLSSLVGWTDWYWMLSVIGWVIGLVRGCLVDILPIRVQKFEYRQNFSLFFGQHFEFHKKYDFCPKSWFLNKIKVFDQNYDVWPKFRFWQKFLFFTQITILDQN